MVRLKNNMENKRITMSKEDDEIPYCPLLGCALVAPAGAPVTRGVDHGVLFGMDHYTFTSADE